LIQLKRAAGAPTDAADAMKRFLNWLILLPLLAIGAAIALANRQMTTIYFDPFPNGGPNGPQLSAPFWLILFTALMAGVLIGGVASWLGQATHRRAARRARAELRRLNAERARQNLQQPAIEYRKRA
jgi:uncharacterized integral membrane protein